MHKLSVIIPLKDDEEEHIELVKTLESISMEDLLIDSLEIIISSEKGRALSLNIGAQKASGDYLWFLHADTEITKNNLTDLIKTIDKSPESLLFFDLSFCEPKSIFMKLNEIGLYFRSHILKTPFGDQGFCIKKELFDKLGGYPENTEYGEDHIFIWKARQNNIAIEPINSKIYTSARKYTKNGWVRTTLLHQYLWIKQAYPEWRKLHKMRKT